MNGWSTDDLSDIGDATELQVSSIRSDGTLSPYVTIWGVRVGHEVYVRSAHGSGNGWFRRARASGSGRVRASGVERDVAFVEPGPGVHGEIDAAYHRKYDRYGPAIVGRVVGAEAAAATLRLDDIRARP